MNWLPEATGILPRWLLLVAGLAMYNSAQSFSTKLNLVGSRIYTLTEGKLIGTVNLCVKVSGLASRLMGTWTFTSAIIRAYTAYNIHNRVMYDVCIWSYVIAWTSFAAEVFLFKTAKVSSPGVFLPFIISSGSLYWMISQRDYYTKP
jgi:hypothetical protein